MTTTQKVIKYMAMAFAVFLAVSIIGGILGVFGLFSGLFGDDAVLGEATTYTVSGDITRLDIQINAADFTIEEADAFSVKSNLKNLTVKDNDGVLTIKEDKKYGISYTDAMLILYIPADTVFDKIDITTGAGRLTVDTLSADALDLKLGAGEVAIDSLTANSAASIEGGAGKITIKGGILHNLDLNMGVGQLYLTAAILGKSDLELGIGKTDITLIGIKEDYKIDAEKGIGNIIIDGEAATNYAGSGNGENVIDIEGGIGSINLTFKSEQA